MQPSLSVIIPALNEEKFIEGCLISIREEQKKSNVLLETIVVDNGSEDKTSQIALKYTDKIFNYPHQGASRARNYGASQAQSENLIFLDANTRLTPGCLEKTLAALAEGYVGGDYLSLTDKKGLKYDLMWVPGNLLRHFIPFYTPIIYCKKWAWEKAGGWDEKTYLTEEIKLLRALKKVGKLKTIAAPVFTSTRRVDFENYFYLIYRLSLGYFSLRTNEWAPVRYFPGAPPKKNGKFL